MDACFFKLCSARDLLLLGEDPENAVTLQRLKLHYHLSYQ